MWLTIIVIRYNPCCLLHVLLLWAVVLWPLTTIAIDDHDWFFPIFVLMQIISFLYFFLRTLPKFPQSSFNLAVLSDTKILSLWYQCASLVSMSSVVDDSITPSSPVVAVHIYIPVDNVMWLPWFTLLTLWLTFLTILIMKAKENNF